MKLKSVAEDGLPPVDVICWVFFTTQYAGDEGMLAARASVLDGAWSSRQDGHEGGSMYGEVTHYYEMPTCLADALSAA